MTAIRHTLQKDVFEPGEERLVSVINVMKPKKKKTCFLCLTVTIHHPIVVKLHQIKTEKNGGFKKRRFWLLREIKQVDGINPRKPISDLEITTEKVYKWVVTNITEKEPFIKQLWKLANRYLPAQKPDFVNVSLPVDEIDYQSGTGAALSSGDGGSQQEEEADDYQPISNKEEADFRQLLARAQMSIGDAEAFADRLTKELLVLDGANIQSIMGSEKAIGELMDIIDSSLNEATRLEQQLDQFDSLLQNVRDNVDLMQEKDNVIGIQTTNKNRLMEDLRQFISAVDLSPENVQILEDCNLSDPTNINRCTRAAQQLQKCLQARIDPGLAHMKSYKDQMKQFRRLSENLSERLFAHLSALFQNLVALNEEAPQWHHLALPKHSHRHHALMPFADLVSWLKQTRIQSHNDLRDRYVADTKELYRKELMAFFEALKGEVKISSFDRKGSVKLADAPRIVKSPSAASNLSRGSDPVVLSERDKFQKLIETLLSEMEPVVLAEQKFCVRFFHISSEFLLATDTQSIGSGDSGSMGTAERRMEKQFNEQVRLILGQLFQPLHKLLEDFVTHCERANPIFIVFLFARLSKHVLAVQDTGSYISVILGTVVVLAKRRFDVFMENETQRLADVKLTKKARVGLLDSLARFEELLVEAEAACRFAERRGDVMDRWYPLLTSAVCDGIEKAAEDPNSKAPPAVVRMENYHKLYSILSEIKIPSLDGMRKQAKQLQQDNVRLYAKEYMGRPMEKLSVFFEQVSYYIEQGMRPEEVGYQQAFSKQELKRVIAQYPAKEVRRGLEQLYRKVEKHLSDDGNLLQVVWHSMQDEFLQQYKQHDQLIAQCYPNANIQMDFSLPDLLQFFSDIALQH